jgi:hypothetical protein
VAHRTGRSATRQKARMAFQVCLQRLLAALGYKRDPRRMEESPTHSLSILRHPDSAPAHSLCCVRDLSSIRVTNSLCCHLSSSLHLCAWVCCVFESCVCCSSQPYSVFFCDLYCKGERLQFVEIPRKREQYSKEKTMVFKLIIGSLERG